MIKSLRKKFICVAMCSTFVVLAAVMGIVNITNYIKMTDRADKLTALLGENDGKWFGHSSSSEFEKHPKGPRQNGFSPETPYETRFFTVTLDEEGSVQSTDTDKIAAIHEEDAKELAKAIFETQSEKGFQDVYRYRRIDTDGGSIMIFLDCRQELTAFRTLMFTSAAVSVLGLLAVFILVLIFSKLVFRPVAESYEKQKQFITDASHEIKTPLTIIDANTEVLEMENGENQWTKSTRNQVKRLAALTQQLITLSRLDEEGIVEEKMEFSLSDAVLESVQPFEALAITQGKTMYIQIEEDIRLWGQEKSIRQMVGILLDNAVKYTSDEGEIRVCLKRKGKKSQLMVWNQADEIPKGRLDILLERFYRLDTSRNSETGGSGIGLSVAQAIVLSHKGKLSLYSEDGKSLLVTVVL